MPVSRHMGPSRDLTFGSSRNASLAAYSESALAPTSEASAAELLRPQSAMTTVLPRISSQRFASPASPTPAAFSTIQRTMSANVHMAAVISPLLTASFRPATLLQMGTTEQICEANLL